jgi:hypothetical protein
LSAEPTCFRVARLEISDIPVTVVFAGADVQAGHEQLYVALISAMPQADVVLVWQDSCGRTQFIAPVQQHRLFETIKYDQLLAHAEETIVLTRF